jgi:plasmid stabilization system protein ParE
VDNALAWEERVRAAIQNLCTLPTRNPVDGAATERMGRDIRKIVFERNYLIFYHVDEAKRSIDILNFRHGARLPRRDEP